MGIAARISKRTAVIGAVSAIAIASGIAYAAWTISGAGSATASAGTATGVNFTPGTTDGTLYPGATVNVKANGSNPNLFPVDFTFSGATVAVTVPVTTKLSGTCASGSVTFRPAADPVHLPAKVGSANGSVSNAIVGTATMAADADNACQGATFTFTLAGSGLSAASPTA